ncbi:Phosphoribosylanthranilate isomerase [Methanolacinia petrolearia DSM 11571]|uniref:N-(5'-phosphoribosyl)anthranilate isomerase n=1 Tax=Methanolacinia petrolearia (strain DSM 11571 / OCM 486 / SEBR 4847) TaxID=679926 RepID=E1RES6_METP4|nr:Phosphoribosylanthranilate isomerase [Methanolacinia petrolearia DSM 11571]
MFLRVKICGITNTSDALFAERSGADAIGVVISEESPRCISTEDAKEIFSALGPFTATVIVTHTNSQDLLDEMAAVNPSAIQVSADVNRPEDYRGKMIRVAGADGKIREDCDAIIIDQSHGKGIPFDYEHAEKLMKSATKPVILAGGLNMSNVPAAISRLQPYAVDVCSGVEKSPGIKDPMKVLEFLKAAGKIPVVRKKEKISR